MQSKGSKQLDTISLREKSRSSVQFFETIQYYIDKILDIHPGADLNFKFH